MEITIEWTEQSKQQLRDIFVYYMTEAGLAVADQIVDRIVKRVEILLKNPQSEPVEPLLSEYQGDYRYLVEGNYKIIYLLSNNHISVLAIFDCRQNPQKLSV